MTAHRDFHSVNAPASPRATLAWGDTTVWLTASEFFHLRECFGAHGFEPNPEHCALCRALAGRLGFFADGVFDD